MRTFTILFLIIFSLPTFSQWQKTEWRCDAYVSGIRAFGDVLYLKDIDSAHISRDNGNTWQNIYDENHNALSPQVDCIFILDDRIIISVPNGFMYSSDFGSTWDYRDRILPEINSALPFYNKRDTLFTAVSGKGILKSTDFGQSWISLSDIKELRPERIGPISFNKDMIFVGAIGGVYLSEDNGENWEFKSNGLPEYRSPSYFVFNEKREIFIIFEENSEGYHQYFYSKDNGNTWIERPNNINFGINDIEYTSINDTIIISGNNKLFYSHDMGENWIEMTDVPYRDFPGWSPSSLYSVGDDIYLCLEGDIFKSSDFGKSWIDFKPKNYRSGYVMSMTMINDNLFVYSDILFAFQNEPGIYKSSDMGNSWEKQVFDDTLKGIVNVFSNGNLVIVSTPFEFYVSTNSGDTWQKKENNANLVFYDMVFSGDTIFARSDWKGVFISTDMGESWEPRNDGLTKQDNIQSINILGDYLFVGYEYSGLYRSSDRGISWSPINDGLPEISVITNIGVIENTILINIHYKGIYASTDYGESWQERNEGLPSNPLVGTFHTVGNTIFASLLYNSDDIIYMSYDKGQTWLSMSEGLMNNRITSFANNGEYIFAAPDYARTGIKGATIYRAKLSDLGVINSIEDRADRISIYTNPPYPIPATNEVRVGIALKENKNIENCEIKIYNIYGAEVSGKDKIRLDVQTYNSANLVWDCSDVPTGTYLIHINSSTESNIIKVVVEK